MTENTAAPAPVTEEVTPNEASLADVTTTETDGSDAANREAMSGIYDRLHAQGDTEEVANDSPPEEAADAPDGEEAVAKDEPGEKETPPVEDKPPSDLPGGIKSQWANLSIEARNAITESHREMATKNADMGRQNQATKPVYDVLVNAAREIPELAGMTPEQIGAEVFTLAKANAQITRDPVNTLLGLVQKFNVGPQMAQAMGQQASGQNVQFLQGKIADLEQKLTQAGNTEFLEQQFTQFTAKQQANDEVLQFANSAEHWADVEADITLFIEPARNALPPGASNADTLGKAYELALFARGIAVKAEDGEEPSPQPDPFKAQQVKKATSVNLPGTASDSKRNLTDREKMSAAYDRAMSK